MLQYNGKVPKGMKAYKEIVVQAKTSYFLVPGIKRVLTEERKVVISIAA